MDLARRVQELISDVERLGRALTRQPRSRIDSIVSEASQRMSRSTRRNVSALAFRLHRTRRAENSPASIFRRIRRAAGQTRDLKVLLASDASPRLLLWHVSPACRLIPHRSSTLDQTCVWLGRAAATSLTTRAVRQRAEPPIQRLPQRLRTALRLENGRPLHRLPQGPRSRRHLRL